MQKYDIVEHPSFYTMEMTKDGKYYLVAEGDEQIAALKRNYETKLDIEYDNRINLGKQVADLKAENERLREALEKIAEGTEDMMPPFTCMPREAMQKIAQAALRGKEVKDES